MRERHQVPENRPENRVLAHKITSLSLSMAGPSIHIHKNGEQLPSKQCTHHTLLLCILWQRPFGKYEIECSKERSDKLYGPPTQYQRRSVINYRQMLRMQSKVIIVRF